MLGKAGKLRILTRSSEDLGIARGDRTATLTLKCAGHDRSPTWLGPSAYEFIDEVDEFV
jgi:hypothetical protein